MVANTRGPETEHAVERDEHSKEVREEEHGLGADVEIFLDVPVAEG